MRRVLGVRRAAGRLTAALLGIPALASCAAISSASFSGSGAPSAAVGDDGSTLSGQDAAVAVDAYSCQPGQVQTYAASPYRPAAARFQNACTMQDMADYYADCFASSTRSQTACDRFTARSSTCSACIVTPSTSSRLGPLILDGAGWVRDNVAGCIELSTPGDSAGLACAKAVQALTGCELAACKANCPVVVDDGDASPLAPYQVCARQADAVGCAAYAEPATCADRDAALAVQWGTAACLATSLKEFYDYAVPLFCAAAASGEDAGAFALDSSAGGSQGSDAVPSDANADVGDAPAAEPGPNSDATTDGSMGGRPSDGAPRDAPRGPAAGGAADAADAADAAVADAPPPTGSSG